MLQRLAEAEARIQDHVLLLDAGGDGGLEALGQLVAHLPHHVVVARIGLHRARVAAHVHEAHGRLTLGDQGQQAGSPRPAVTSFTSTAPALRAASATSAREVSTESAIGGGSSRTARSTPVEAGELLHGAHGSRPGAGALGADVADRGALARHLGDALHGLSGSIGPAPPHSESGVTLRIPITQGPEAR